MTPCEEIFLDNKINGRNGAKAARTYILAARQGHQLHQAITDLRARPDGEGVLRRDRPDLATRVDAGEISAAVAALLLPLAQVHADGADLHIGDCLCKHLLQRCQTRPMA
jgi:hypothetical protein